MYVRLAASAFFGVCVFTLAAAAQQSPPAQPKVVLDPMQPPPPPMPGGPGRPSTPVPPIPGMPAPPPIQKIDSLDAQIQAAMANDATAKLAQARVQVAEAELAKARQAVILKVMTLNGTIEDLKRQVALLAEKSGAAERMLKMGTGSPTDVLEVRLAFERVKGSLGIAEMELKLLSGGAQKERGLRIEIGSGNAVVQLDDQLRDTVMAALKLQSHTYVKKLETSAGPIQDRLRETLDKPVKLAPKGEAVTFAKALEIFKKEAGLDVPVRNVQIVPPIISQGETLPVGAWLQLFADNLLGAQEPDHVNGQLLFTVRDYGILASKKDLAPANAVTVNDLWKEPLNSKKSTQPAAKDESFPKRK